jgi:ABC-type amino acid transport substrate-binding protein
MLIMSLPVQSESIKTVGPQSEHDASHDYFIQLLRLSLNEGGNLLPLEIIEHQAQARAIQLLRDTDIYDILWTGQSNERDEMLLEIPIPLFLGGLGIRGAIIKKSFLPIYQNAQSISDLKGYLACQGQHWPDADKLEYTGINVVRVLHFDSMLKMVNLGRCDYLPLSIFEGEGELQKVKSDYPSLVFNTDVLFQYEQKMFFYVKRKDQKLAQQVELGLKLLKDSGRLLQFMENHPLTRLAFPLSKYKNSTIIPLDNSPRTLF